MRNRSIPAVLAIVLLFIITGLTVVFVSDFYSAYGQDYSKSLYGDAVRSPLFGTKSFDAAAVDSAIQKEEASEAAFYKELYSQFKDVTAADPAADASVSKPTSEPASAASVQSTVDPKATEGMQGGSDAGKKYVVYSESAAAGGGI